MLRRMKNILLKTILILSFFISIISCQNESPALRPSTVELLSADSLQGIAGEPIASPVEIIVKDQNGNPLKDIPIKWELSEGSFTSLDFTTNADGKASATWLFGHSENSSLTIKVFNNDQTEQITGSPVIIKATVSVPGKVTDIDGNEYGVVRIGKQIWLTENLRTTKYSDGTPIPLVEDSAAWAKLRISEKAYCYNIENNDARYGLLYTYGAATNGDGFGTYTKIKTVQGVCPVGWHIPKYDEWNELATELGGWGIAGGKMKEAGTQNWLTPNAGATNKSGFTALPSGYRSNKGTFFYLGESAGYWCILEEWGIRKSTFWYAHYNTAGFGQGGEMNGNSGFSVRCLMD